MGPPYPLTRGLGGPQTWSGRFEEEVNLFPLLAIETLFLGSQYPNKDTVVTELSRLLKTGKGKAKHRCYRVQKPWSDSYEVREWERNMLCHTYYMERRRILFISANSISWRWRQYIFNFLNAELNPICHLLALLRAHHIFHVSGLTVKFS
jgi:hypothetical protein